MNDRLFLSRTQDPQKRHYIEYCLKDLSAEQLLKGLSAEERLKGLSAEERLKGIEPEIIEAYLEKIKTQKRS